MKIISLFLILCFSIPAQDFGDFGFFDTDGFNSVVTDWNNRVIANGGTAEPSVLVALQQFDADISSIRSKIVRFNPFAGNNLSSALVPFYYNTDGSSTPVGNSTDANTNFVSADYSVSGGLGDASNTNKFLSTGVNPSTNSTLGQNDITFGVWTLDNGTYDAVLISAWDGTNGVNIFYSRRASNQAYTAVNNAGGATPSVTVSNEIGMNIQSRLSGTSYTYTLNMSDQGVTQGSTTEPNANFLIFRYAGNYGKNKLSGYIISAGLSWAERVILYNAWSNLKTALGR